VRAGGRPRDIIMNEPVQRTGVGAGPPTAAGPASTFQDAMTHLLETQIGSPPGNKPVSQLENGPWKGSE
jgi:hypothetical protein